MENSQNGEKGPWISHLMFADDLLITGEENKIQMKSVVDILYTFGDMFEQEASEEKTIILFPRRCLEEQGRN